jgi:hypothetical protein
MPLMVSVPGYVIGYVCYDLTHYMLHHVQFKGGIGKLLRAHHMRHHTEWKEHYSLYPVSRSP